MTIVVFCPNLIGDTVMATPAFGRCGAAYPGRDARRRDQAARRADARRHALARRRDPASTRSRATAASGRAPSGRGSAPSGPISPCCFPNSFRSALLAWAAGIPRRVGYARGGRGVLLTDRLTVPRDAKGARLPVPAVEYYLAIVRRLGCRVDSVRTELPRRPTTRPPPTRAWAALGLADDGRSSA